MEEVTEAVVVPTQEEALLAAKVAINQLNEAITVLSSYQIALNFDIKENKVIPTFFQVIN